MYTHPLTYVVREFRVLRACGDHKTKRHRGNCGESGVELRCCGESGTDYCDYTVSSFIAVVKAESSIVTKRRRVNFMSEWSTEVDRMGDIVPVSEKYKSQGAISVLLDGIFFF